MFEHDIEPVTLFIICIAPLSYPLIVTIVWFLLQQFVV
ncbi:hypothetical protein JCM19240_5477 [Vibrio maritimus]|uniref:Uncharacterized protein n=1 Tax=Vibrio maritimus TaxID=990268 RepID=A0A090SWJ8_9VIBR|nr:hypothetical protein JCM19240_5477 [Vibrio maritimus]